MATLSDLGRSFLEIPPNERFELIREIRAKRRVAPTTPRKSKAGSSKRAAKSAPSVNNLTKEQAQQLLALLGENDED